MMFAGSDWLLNLRGLRSILLKILLVIPSADRPIRHRDEPHSDLQGYTRYLLDHLQDPVPCGRDKCFRETFSLRLFFLYHLHDHSKRRCSHRWPIHSCMLTWMHLVRLLVARSLAILCRVLVVRSTCPGPTYLLLLHHLVIWAIKVLVRNYRMSRKCWKDNFLLLTKILEWAT